MKNTSYETVTGKSVRKGLVQLAAVTGLLFAVAAATEAAIILVDPTTHDGSFESRYTGGNVTDESNPSTADWAVLGSGYKAGVLGRPGGDPTTRFDTIAASHIAGANGGISLFADRGGSAITVTFADLIGTNGYTPSAGDTINYSVDINALGAIGGQNNTASNVSLSLDFGNGLVGTGNLVADGNDGSTGGSTPFSSGFHETLSLTHTVTATDLSGGVLQVIATLTAPTIASGGGNAYIDNILVSATPAVIPEPSTLALLGTAFAGLAALRRRIAK